MTVAVDLKPVAIHQLPVRLNVLVPGAVKQTKPSESVFVATCKLLKVTSELAPVTMKVAEELLPRAICKALVEPTKVVPENITVAFAQHEVVVPPARLQALLPVIDTEPATFTYPTFESLVAT